MKSNNPLVTVYIVNHNYGKYLKQAIESVLKQTLQNFENLVIPRKFYFQIMPA